MLRSQEKQQRAGRRQSIKKPGALKDCKTFDWLIPRIAVDNLVVLSSH